MYRDELPTARQLAFIRTLADERRVTANPVETKREASNEITRLLALPKPPRVAPAAAPVAHPGGAFAQLLDTLKDVPDGRYAVPGLDPDSVDFYRLRTYKGRRFFDKVVGSGYGNGMNRVFTSLPSKIRVAESIAADPYVSAKLFADKLGCCARCLASLTDEVSRARGLGPECVRHWAGRLPVGAL
jgi:hypothetical protein